MDDLQKSDSCGQVSERKKVLVWFLLSSLGLKVDIPSGGESLLWETFSERLLSHLARSPREWPLKLSREQSLSFNKVFLCPVRAVLPNCQGVLGLVCLSVRWVL